MCFLTPRKRLSMTNTVTRHSSRAAEDTVDMADSLILGISVTYSAASLVVDSVDLAVHHQAEEMHHNAVRTLEFI